MRGLWGASMLTVLTAGCGSDTFVCMADIQCGADGRCEQAGVCSFPDPTCPSGHRYADSAGHLSGQCVEDSPGTDTLDSTSTTAPATDAGPSTGSTGPVVDDTATGPSTCEQWWDCAWAARVPLLVSPRDISEPLSQVPVAVFLDPGRFDYGLAQPQGADLRVLSEDHGNILPHELERWSPAGTSVVWIQVDALAPGKPTPVWLYFGNPDAPSIEDAPGVWANDYRAVWHLGEPSLPDSVTGSRSCNDQGVDETEGLLGSAITPQNNGFIDCGSDGLDELFVGGGTLSAWILPYDSGGAGSGRIVDKATDTTPGGYNLAMNNERVHFARGHTLGLGLWVTPDGSVPFDQWRHVAVTYVEGNADTLPAIFVDGVPQVLTEDSDPAGSPDVEQGVSLSIGNHAETGSRTFDGIIDEVRLSGTLRSEDWLRFQAASGRDEVIEYGSVEYGSVEPSPARG